jgi:hypothetical protein
MAKKVITIKGVAQEVTRTVSNDVQNRPVFPLSLRPRTIHTAGALLLDSHDLIERFEGPIWPRAGTRMTFDEIDDL